MNFWQKFQIYLTKRKIKCWFLGHDWTCKTDQNIPPTKEEIADATVDLWIYAKMYCKRCGKESDLNL